MLVKRRQFTSRFKDKLAMEAMKGQRTIGELAGLYQVHPSRIAAWKKRLAECSAMTFEESSVQGSGHSPPALMAQLYEPTGRLQAELICARSPQSKGANRAPARGDWESFWSRICGRPNITIFRLHTCFYIYLLFLPDVSGWLAGFGQTWTGGGARGPSGHRFRRGVFVYPDIVRHQPPALAHRPHSRRRTWGRVPSQEWWHY